MLHVERRAVLGLTLGLLRVQAAVHATVAVLSKKGVDGLYPGLMGGTRKEINGLDVKRTLGDVESKLTRIGFP